MVTALPTAMPTPCGLNLMRLPPRDLLLARVIVESLEAG